MKKNWFITGTSSGIGRIMTEKLLSQGDNVFATLRKTEALNDLLTKYPNQIKIAHLELTNNDEIKSVVNLAFDEFGRIDVVVSNAGYGLFGAVEELSDEMICQQLDVNLLGSIRLIKAVIPYMRNQTKGGHIIQVSSEGGQIAYPGFSLYHASKWGIEGFIESMAKDLEPLNIKFNIAEPGPTGTNFGSSLIIAKAMDVYRNTPVNDLRKLIADGFGELDDVNEVAETIINCANNQKTPLRIPIGNVAKSNIKTGLSERLTAFNEQQY